MREARGWAIACAAGLSMSLAQTSASVASNVPANANVSPAETTTPVSFSVYLPLRDRAGLQNLIGDQQNPSSPNYHKWLSPAQFYSRFGPSASTLASATAALQNEGFNITKVQGRAITISGSVGAVDRAFGTQLEAVQMSVGHATIVASAGLVMPKELQSMGAIVPAFSGLARLHTHSKRAAMVGPASRRGPAGGYWFDDLKQAYDYPSYQALDGTGANVAVLISSDAEDSDIAIVFDHERFTAVTGKADPTITHQPVDQPAPTVTDGVDEASLDVQQVLGGAPGAAVTLVDIPDLSDQSTTDGYDYIVSTPAASGMAKFQLVNSSFGGCELFYTAAYNGGVDYTALLDLQQSIFEQGNSEGITFVASSGDSGGLGCPDINYINQPQTAPSRFLAGVEFPAASPNVTAVGGTNLITSYAPASLNSSYVSENAQGDPELPYDPYGEGVNAYGGYWGAGGGLSQLFAKPNYQALLNTGSPTYRTLPDIGMQVGGCPYGALSPCPTNRSFVIVAIQGGLAGLIGTSVASPEFVGALALVVQRYGAPLGNINPYLYTQGAAQSEGRASGYHQNIPGFDGKYLSTFPAPGYNYLVGVGTPDIRKLFGLTALAPAGVPQTATNP